jgi:O-antigen ligase
VSDTARHAATIPSTRGCDGESFPGFGAARPTDGVTSHTFPVWPRPPCNIPLRATPRGSVNPTCRAAPAAPAVSHRFDLVRWRAGLAVLGLAAAALGLLSVRQPTLALEITLGIPFVLIVFVDLPLGVGVFLLSQFLLPNVGSMAKVGGLLLLVASLSRAPSGERRNNVLAAHPGLCVLIGASVAWVVLTISWATDGSMAASNALRYAQNATLFIVVFAAVRTRRDVTVILGAFVLGAALSAAYGFAGGANLTQPGRLVGTTGEANQLATYLVAGLLLSIALAAASRRFPPVALGATACGAICALGVALTLSRAALVALVLALIAAIVVVKRHRGAISLVAILLAGGFAVYFLAIAPPQARERILYNPSGTSGRTALWTVAWRVVAAHPVTGVGIGNFPLRSVDFLVRPGSLSNDRYVIQEPLEAHNIYLQLLAETGVVGFLLFAAVVAASLSCCWRAARARAPAIDGKLVLLAEATLVATVAVLVANFFAPGLFDKQMWLLFAMAPALLSLSRNNGTQAATEDHRLALAAPVW